MARRRTLDGADWLRSRWREVGAESARWLLGLLVAFVVFGHAGLIAVLLLWAAHLAWDPPPALTAGGAAGAFVVAGVTWLASGVPDLDTVHLVTRRSVPSLLAVVGTVALVVAAWVPSRPSPGEGLEGALARSREIVAGLARRAAQPGRLPEMALPRAVAIVVVIWIHALPAEFASSRIPFDRWLGDVTRFAVPVFVFAAGYLVARRPLGQGWLRQRLERLLAPYLVASVVAIALRSWSAAFPPIEHPVADLLVGATFGPYYFVLVLVALALATPLLLALPQRAVVVTMVAAVAAQVLTESLVEPIFWRVRNPLLWLAFYLAGILAWRHRRRLLALAHTWPYTLVAWAVVATALVVVPDDTLVRDVLTLAASWLMVATLWLAGAAAGSLPRIAWWLDAATYPLYLFHLPFVLVVAGPVGASILSLGSAAGWATGLIGAMSVIVIGRHVLGNRARTLLGA